MISCFVKEDYPYSVQALLKIFGYLDDDGNVDGDEFRNFLQKLAYFKLIKLSQIKDDSLEIENAETLEMVLESSDYLNDSWPWKCKFKFVGVVVVEGRVIKSFPKYIFNGVSDEYSSYNANQEKVLEQKLTKIVRVIKKYKNLEVKDNKFEVTKASNIDEIDKKYDLLGMAGYLIRDYHENGLYTNQRIETKLNGEGEIFWDKTVDNIYPVLKNNRPYYFDCYVKHRKKDDQDYFQRLHKYVLDKCTRTLRNAGLLSIFDVLPVEFSDVDNNFGDVTYIKKRIKNELNVQFVNRKQSVLKMLYRFFKEKGFEQNEWVFDQYYHIKYNEVWEKVCSRVAGSLLLDKKLEDYIKGFVMSHTLPKWSWSNNEKNNNTYGESMKLDAVCISDNFLAILDAKYYLRKFNLPGVQDVSKEYLYMKAFKSFFSCSSKDSNVFLKNEVITPNFNYDTVNKLNCFLMPSCEDLNDLSVVDNGSLCEKVGQVTMKMFEIDKEPPIYVFEIFPSKLYDLYLSGRKYKFVDELLEKTGS